MDYEVLIDAVVVSTLLIVFCLGVLTGHRIGRTG